MSKNKSFHECLSQVKDVLTWSEQQDLSGLQNFLQTDPEKPLYCVSSGGSSSPLVFASLLYSCGKGMARALSPLSYMSVSDETLQNSKTFILSKSGKGVDNNYLVKRALTINPGSTAALTHTGDSNNLITKFQKKGNSAYFAYDWEDQDGFIATLSPFAVFGLLYKTFTNDDKFVNEMQLSMVPADNYTYRYLRADDLPEGVERVPQSFDKNKNYLVLYAGWSEPVAYDFESKMVEAGYASVQLCDYRNFTHGRFLFLSNHLEDTVLVLLITPRERTFAEQLILEGKDRHSKPLFPANTQVVLLESEFNSSLATLDLLFKESVLFDEVGTCFGYDSNNPVNRSKIDKGIPKNKRFKGITTEYFHGLKTNR